MKLAHTIDEYKVVLHTLRHKCKSIKNFEKAVLKIVKETKLPEEKVKNILREMYKD